MAIPSNLADLFGPKINQPDAASPDLSKITGLQLLSYKITWDAIDDGTVPPELRPQLAELYETVRHRPDRALVERLRQLVRQYPNAPALKNYLMLAYVQTGQKSRANEVLDLTIRQHPRYLMGLVNKAHQLLLNEDTEGVEKLFGGPLTDISLFYPERSEFHASEVANFTHVAFAYDIAKVDPDAAESRLRLLRDLGYHTKDQLRSMKNQLNFARMKFNMARMQEGFEKAVTVGGYFRAEDQQTTEPPRFQHPEMRWLYEFGFDIPADKRNELLALPRPSLLADLSKVLLDTVYRHAYFLEQDRDQQRHNFASHALLLATELRADECLDAVLETLRQDVDFQEFWWGDFLDDFYEPYFRRLLPKHADRLRAFLLEPDVNAYAKSAITDAYAQGVLDHPDLKPAARLWYADVLTYLIENTDDKRLFDSDLLAYLIGDAVDLQLTDLLPLIRVAYGRGLVSEQIQGGLSEVEREMTKRTFPLRRRPIRPLAEEYEFFRDPAAYRKAHPDLEQEDARDEFLKPLEERESEWDFLYEDDEDEDEPNGVLLPSQGRQVQSPPGQPRPGRNDKVSVRYTDGTVVRDVKYKKVEPDVEAGTCVLI
ncbi:MAG: hypothetical protein LH606_16270 [Cytophagaceae bacterium]|nr:hypothetical protein [Cytophagaceae bacterium]